MLRTGLTKSELLDAIVGRFRRTNSTQIDYGRRKQALERRITKTISEIEEINAEFRQLLSEYESDLGRFEDLKSLTPKKHVLANECNLCYVKFVRKIELLDRLLCRLLWLWVIDICISDNQFEDDKNVYAAVIEQRFDRSEFSWQTEEYETYKSEVGTNRWEQIHRQITVGATGSVLAAQDVITREKDVSYDVVASWVLNGISTTDNLEDSGFQLGRSQNKDGVDKLNQFLRQETDTKSLSDIDLWSATEVPMTTTDLETQEASLHLPDPASIDDL